MKVLSVVAFEVCPERAAELFKNKDVSTLCDRS